MNKIFKSSPKKFLSIFAALALAIGVAAPASAQEVATTVSALDLSQTPELSYDSTSVQVDQFCFKIKTTAADETSYKFADLTFTGVREGKSVTVALGSREYYSWDNQFMICTVDQDWNPLTEVGDPQKYTSVALAGRSVTATTFTDAFANQLKTYGLAITEGAPLAAYYNSYDGTQFNVEVINTTKKVVAVSISKFKFNNSSLGSKSFNLVLKPGGTEYMNFGSLTQDVSVGFKNAVISATFTKVTPAKVTRKTIVVPTGLQLATTEPTDWYYYPAAADAIPNYSNTTHLCQNVKNTTKKAITVENKFTFSAPNRKTVAYKGTSVITIPAGETYCLEGGYDNRANPSGDWRLTNTVTIDGTLKVVTGTSIDTTGLVLPKGYKVLSTGVSYDDDTKMTSFRMSIDAPTDVNKDLLISDLSFNGKTKLSVVAQGCQCGGPGIGHLLVVELAKAQGDLRIGKKLSAKGTFMESTPVELNSEIESEYTLGCFAWYSSEWVYSSATKKTTVSLFCNNLSTAAKKLDLSTLRLKVTVEGKTLEYKPTISSVTLAAKTQAKVVDVFVVAGDVRTGGASLLFTGSVK